MVYFFFIFMCLLDSFLKLNDRGKNLELDEFIRYVEVKYKQIVVVLQFNLTVVLKDSDEEKFF